MSGTGAMVGAMVATDLAMRGGSALLGSAKSAAAARAAAAAAAAGGTAVATGGGLGLATTLFTVGGTAVTVGTVGIIAAVAAAVGGLGYAIYWHVDRTDKEVGDLIDRIRNLDYEGTDVAPTVVGWINNLTALRETFATYVGTGTPQERLMGLGTKIIAFERGVKVLVTVKEQYDKYIKEALKDWWGSWGDKGDFERALNKTTANYTKRLASMTSDFRKLQAQTSNPSLALEEVRKLETEITNTWAAPAFDAQEQKVLAWATAGGTEGSVQEIRQNTAALIKLKSALQNKILPQAKQRSKRNRGKMAGLNRPISKRAVTLPDLPPRPARKVVPKLDTVQTMQEQVNDLSVALGVNIGGRIAEDGIYGNNTANAVGLLVHAFAQADPKKYPAQVNLAINLKSQGVTDQEISNPKLMVATARLLNRLTNAIATVWSYHVAGQGKGQPLSQRGPGGVVPSGARAPGEVYTGPDKCDRSALNPTLEQMLGCFKTLEENIGGERVYLYDYASENLNMSDDDIQKMLDRLFGRVPPNNWSRSRLMAALGNRFTIL